MASVTCDYVPAPGKLLEFATVDQEEVPGWERNHSLLTREASKQIGKQNGVSSAGL